jgi:hypothetical protein
MSQGSTARNLEITSPYILVRGILLPVAGPGGEATGKAISLDRALQLEGHTVWSLDVDGVKDPASTKRTYVEASGPISYRKGTARPFWPVLEVAELRALEIDGRASKEKELVQKVVTLTIEPAVFTWTNLAGQPQPSPKVTYSVTNTSRTTLDLTFHTTEQVSFVVRDATTKQDLWKNPKCSGDVVTHLKLQTGETFTRTIDLPREAAPNPGTYIMDVSLSGQDQFDLTTRFVVGIS